MCGGDRRIVGETAKTTSVLPQSGDHATPYETVPAAATPTVDCQLARFPAASPKHIGLPGCVKYANSAIGRGCTAGYAATGQCGSTQPAQASKPVRQGIRDLPDRHSQNLYSAPPREIESGVQPAFCSLSFLPAHPLRRSVQVRLLPVMQSVQQSDCERLHLSRRCSNALRPDPMKRLSVPVVPAKGSGTATSPVARNR